MFTQKTEGLLSVCVYALAVGTFKREAISNARLKLEHTLRPGQADVLASDDLTAVAEHIRNGSWAASVLAGTPVARELLRQKHSVGRV